MRIYSHGCPLDCFGCCKFNVYVDNGKIVKVEGDKSHPYTKGIICIKGRKNLERMRHPQRQTKPLKKVGGKWVEIEFAEALEIVSQKLLHFREKYGSNSILHYSESGAGGVLKAIEDIFFNFFGGITTSRGSTCWGAGMAAQFYDFGDARGHFLEDMLKSKCIIMWGRNPANTSLHLMNMCKQARAAGTKIIVIDPIHTQTADAADIYVRINPSTDGALAMAMTKVIIEEGMLDRKFIDKNVKGFPEYEGYLDTLVLRDLSAETGVSQGLIKKLAVLYGKDKPSAIYPGYGLQKYRNSGNAVRAIDALGAVTGNIGLPGGGVNYANRVYPDILNLDPFNSRMSAKNQRFFNVADFGDFITRENNPPVKAIFVSKANPLAQFPNVQKAAQAFDRVDFKVCIDMFLTDTAAHCDLFLPCTNTFESEDLLYSSMSNPYIIYNEKIVEPADKLMDEYCFFQELAGRMGLEGYPVVSKQDYLDRVIEPLKLKGINLETIKNEAVTVQAGPVAWNDLNFRTPSGKIEIYSEQAMAAGLSPIPVYSGTYRYNGLRLITTHYRESIFSQHFLDVKGISEAYLNQATAREYSLDDGVRAVLRSPQGEIKVQIKLSERIPDNTVHMYTGWWEKHGNPNVLTSDISSEMGGQVAYHETFVEIRKLEEA